MTDLSKLSDSDLESVAKGDMTKVSDEGLSLLAGESGGGKNLTDRVGSFPKAAAENYIDKATLGHGPQLEGAFAKPLAELNDANTPMSTKAADLALMMSPAYLLYKTNKAAISPDADYLPARDAALHRLQEYDQPSMMEPEKGSRLGAMLGRALGIGTNMATLSGITPFGSASSGARVANATAGGGAYGGLSNPGDIEGKIDPLQIEDRGWNAGKGALSGLILSGGLEAANAKAGPWSEKKAVSSLLGTQKQQELLGDKTPAAGRIMLDDGILGPTTSRSTMAERLDTANTAAKQQYGSMIKNAEAAGAPPVDTQQAALSILNNPELSQLKTTPGASKAYSQILDELQVLYDNGQMPITEANALKGRIDTQIAYGKSSFADPSAKSLQPWLYQMRDQLREHINDSVNQMGTASPDELKTLGQKINILDQLSKMADKGATRDQANQSISIGDKIAGVGTSALGHDPATKTAFGIAGAAVNKGARAFGKQGAAYLGGKVLPYFVEAVNSNPEIAHQVMQQIAPQSLQTTRQNTLLPDQQIMDEFKQNPAALEQLNDPKLRALIQEQLTIQPSSAIERRMQQSR